MTKWAKTLLCIALSLSFVFIGIGYAEFAETLIVNGIAEYSHEYNEVIVSSVQLHSATNCTSEHSRSDPTNVYTKITPDQGVGTNATMTVIYKLTAYNFSAYKTAFSEIVSPDLYDNALVTSRRVTVGAYADAACTVSLAGKSLESGEELEFYAKYQVSVSNVPGDGKLDLLLNYKFGLHVDSAGQAAIDATFAQFLNVLNSKETVTIDGVTATPYEHFTDAIDNKYDGTDWKANFIGNVTNANMADTAIIKALMGESLSITIGNTSTNVTLLVKRDNIDNDETTGDAYTATYVQQGYWGQGTTHQYSDSGCEMTLYMTADSCATSGRWVDVYVAVFTCESDENGTPISDWYQIGDMYHGQAQVVGYTGNDGSTKTGSFWTDVWKPFAGTHVVTKNYTYHVAANNITYEDSTHLKNLMQTKANVRNNGDTTSAWAELNSLNSTAQDVLNGVYGNFAGQAILNLQAVQAKAADLIAKDTAGNGSIITRAETIPVLRELEAALTPFERYMTGAN